MTIFFCFFLHFLKYITIWCHHNTSEKVTTEKFTRIGRESTLLQHLTSNNQGSMRRILLRKILYRYIDDCKESNAFHQRLWRSLMTLSADQNQRRSSSSTILPSFTNKPSRDGSMNISIKTLTIFWKKSRESKKYRAVFSPLGKWGGLFTPWEMGRSFHPLGKWGGLFTPWKMGRYFNPLGNLKIFILDKK